MYHSVKHLKKYNWLLFFFLADVTYIWNQLYNENNRLLTIKEIIIQWINIYSQNLNLYYFNKQKLKCFLLDMFFISTL